MREKVKILAIGNSYSVDCMEYLWDICNEAGLKEIVLGNLYIGGCSLERHYQNILSNSLDYIYYKNTEGEWVAHEEHGIWAAIRDENWDIVTINQASNMSGIPESYVDLEKILDFVYDNVSSGCQVYWNATWAYEQTTDHSGFANYGHDQMRMYESIVKTVQTVIETNKRIHGIIPVGTTIQNLRNGKLGDCLMRDGYHLCLDYGRYSAALTWFAILIDRDIRKINWVPEKYPYLYQERKMIYEAVEMAVRFPFQVSVGSEE